MRDSDRSNKNEISISVFGVTAKDFSHGRDLDEASLTQLIQSKLKCGGFSASGSGAKFQRYAAVRRQ
jgi:hypothetical protein